MNDKNKKYIIFFKIQFWMRKYLPPEVWKHMDSNVTWYQSKIRWKSKYWEKKKKSIIIPLLSEQNDLLLRFGVPLLPSSSYFYVLQQMYHILY